MAEHLASPPRLDSITLRVGLTDRSNRTTRIDVRFLREECEADLARFIEAIKNGAFVIERNYVTVELGSAAG